MRPVDPQKLIVPFNQRELVPRYRLGSVVSIQSDRTITVTVGGASTQIAGVKYLGSLHPVPNDPIWLVADGTDLFALGVLAAADRTLAPRLYRNANQTITTGTNTKVELGQADSDEWGTLSSYNFVAPMTGRYLATGTVVFDTNATGVRSLWVENGSGTTLGRSNTNATSSGNTWMSVATPAFTLTKADTVSLWVRQTSGGDLVLSASNYSPSLSVVYLGP